MSANKEKNHLVVFSEDKPYREILNGIATSSNIDTNVLDIRQPCGGWSKTLKRLEDEKSLLAKSQCYILVLIDFDDKEDVETQDNFERRMKKFKTIVGEYYDRAFLLGVNHKESENLKKTFNKSNFEEIGKSLIEGCPNDKLADYWQDKTLKCNLDEVNRMRSSGVFEWLFAT
jgi:ribosome biogenesis GTPase A